MPNATIEHELSACLARLPVERQRQVLEFAKTLAGPPIRGTRGADLLRFAGTIDETDLDAISEAVEDGCERVDADEW